MTAHPHQLHAMAALWSLRTVLPRLAAASASARLAATAVDDLGTLQAWRPGSGVHGPANGDMILDAVIRHSGTTWHNPYAERWRRTDQTVSWVTEAVLGEALTPGVGAIAQLVDHVPAMQPADAGHLHLWIDEQDRLVRRVLGEGDDRQMIAAVGCPGCGGASLALRTSAPPARRVIVCTMACPCAGPGCPCGMPVRAAGVAHVWTPTGLAAVLEP